MLFAKQVTCILFFSPTLERTMSIYLFKYEEERMGFVSGTKEMEAQVVLRTTARARAAHRRIMRFSAHFALRTLHFA